MNVDIDIKHPRVILQKLQNPDDNIVDVTKTGRLELLRVVQPAGPVDCDVAVVVVQLHRALERRAGVHGAEVEQPVKDGAVVADVEMAEVLRVVLDVLRRDALEEVDVLFAVEAAHVVRARLVRAVDLHFFMKAVLEDEAVDDGEAVRFHRMSRAVVEVANVRVVKIRYFFVRHF